MKRHVGRFIGFVAIVAGMTFAIAGCNTLTFTEAGGTGVYQRQ